MRALFATLAYLAREAIKELCVIRDLCERKEAIPPLKNKQNVM